MTAHLDDYEQINPNRSPSYSKNLYHWLKVEFSHPAPMVSVYNSQSGIPYIGFIDEGYFIGAKLFATLTYGVKAQAYAHTPKDTKGLVLSVIDTFWDDYRRIGRCAIDPNHNVFFKDEDSRWVQNGKHRICQWCGASQHAETRIQEYEVWKNDARAA